MNKRMTLLLFVVLILSGITGFLYYKKTYFPKYKWYTDYRKSSEQPYGLNLFYSAVKSQDFKTTVLYNESFWLLDTSLGNSNFIMIGEDFYVDSAAASHILKYVEKGNRALISVNEAPLEILRNFVPVGDTIHGFTQFEDSIVNIIFSSHPVPYHEIMQFHYQFLKDTVRGDWSAYRTGYFNDTLSGYGFFPFSILNKAGVNSFFIEHGKGRIYVHASPILFTNYHLVREAGFKHANNFLSQLHQGPTFWYDPAITDGRNSQAAIKNPIKFLFSHPHLRWAWYLFLVTILLYLVFRSKRKQRVIPVMPVNSNASIEYVKALGTLYYNSKGHNHIASEMYTVFLAGLRQRYHIFTDIEQMKLIEQLAIRSGIEKSILYDLFEQFGRARNNPSATGDDLINLHNTLEYYHQRRK